MMNVRSQIRSDLSQCILMFLRSLKMSNLSKEHSEQLKFYVLSLRKSCLNRKQIQHAMMVLRSQLKSDLRQKKWIDQWTEICIPLFLTDQSIVNPIKCLKETHTRFVLPLLKPSAREETSEPDILPLTCSNDKRFSEPVDVVLCSPNSEQVREYWTSPETYSLRKMRRGRCMIINNESFTGPVEKDENGELRVTLPTRHGTQRDVDDISSLFIQFLFTIDVNKNKSAQEILVLLQEASQNPEQWSADCFVLFILSHGTSTGVYGSDGEIVGVEEITAIFNRHNCPALTGKPKLFFIQACRGEKRAQHSIPVRMDQVGRNLPRYRRNGTTALDAGKETNSNVVPLPLLVEPDIFVAQATKPGYVSFRDELNGSWFIQDLVYVFKCSAHEMEINDLFTLVTRHVSKRVTQEEGDGPGGAMQVPDTTCSLSRKLFFFPGVYDRDYDSLKWYQGQSAH